MISKKVVAVAISAACMVMVAEGAQAEISTHTFRFTTVNPKGHPIAAGGEKFGELLAQKSGGKMTVRHFAGGAFGGDLDVLYQIQRGTIDLTSMNTGLLQNQVKEAAMVDLPFLFDSGEEADAVLDGPMGDKLAALMPAKGMVNLGYFDLGFRQITNNKRPIKSADDIKGLKLRVVESPTYVDTFKALGAKPVPMPFTELWGAFSLGMIDGQENPMTVIESNKLFKIQKYLTITNHVYNPQSFLMSKISWDQLNAEEQKVIMEAAKEAVVWQRQFSRAAQSTAFDSLTKSMDVYVLPASEVAKLRQAVKPVVDKRTAAIGADFAKPFLNEIGKVRNAK